MGKVVWGKWQKGIHLAVELISMQQNNKYIWVYVCLFAYMHLCVHVYIYREGRKEWWEGEKKKERIILGKLPYLRFRNRIMGGGQ